MSCNCINNYLECRKKHSSHCKGTKHKSCDVACKHNDWRYSYTPSNCKNCWQSNDCWNPNDSKYSPNTTQSPPQPENVCNDDCESSVLVMKHSDRCIDSDQMIEMKCMTNILYTEFPFNQLPQSIEPNTLYDLSSQPFNYYVKLTKTKSANMMNSEVRLLWPLRSFIEDMLMYGVEHIWHTDLHFEITQPIPIILQFNLNISSDKSVIFPSASNQWNQRCSTSHCDPWDDENRKKYNHIWDIRVIITINIDNSIDIQIFLSTPYNRLDKKYDRKYKVVKKIPTEQLSKENYRIIIDGGQLNTPISDPTNIEALTPARYISFTSGKYDGKSVWISTCLGGDNI